MPVLTIERPEISTARRPWGGVGYGTVYQLKHKGSGWIFNPLFSFPGDFSDGAHPRARVVFGPNGTLYGTTVGRQSSGFRQGGCGTVFNLRPSPTVCKTALCPWTETVLYAFTGTLSVTVLILDMVNLIFDRTGNIYGTTYSGGNLDHTVRCCLSS